MANTADYERMERRDYCGAAPRFLQPGWHPAWIAILVLSFIFFWPLGLVLLFLTIWRHKMGCWHNSERWQNKFERKMEKFRSRMEGQGWAYAPTSGNRAFDEYRMETLKRLEDEQQEFRSFLDRLRHAKDKAEFDQFMADRRTRPATPSAPPNADNSGSDYRPQQ